MDTRVTFVSNRRQTNVAKLPYRETDEPSRQIEKPVFIGAFADSAPCLRTPSSNS